MNNIQFGTITGYDTGTFLNIDNVQILQVTVEGDTDARPALLINPAQDESAPKTGDRVAVLRIGNFNLAIGGIDGIAPATDEGEKRLYSRDGNGDLAAFIFLLSSGVMQLNGIGDNAVRFLELESGFNELKQDVNDHITNWNLFAAAYAPGSPVTLGTPPTASTSGSSTASIADAKIDNIEVPEL